MFTGGTLKILNLGEAYYRVVRVDRRDEAESLWRVALRRTSVSVKDATRQRVRRAIEQVDARDCRPCWRSSTLRKSSLTPSRTTLRNDQRHNGFRPVFGHPFREES